MDLNINADVICESKRSQINRSKGNTGLRNSGSPTEFIKERLQEKKKRQTAQFKQSRADNYVGELSRTELPAQAESQPQKLSGIDMESDEYLPQKLSGIDMESDEYLPPHYPWMLPEHLRGLSLPEAEEECQPPPMPKMVRTVTNAEGEEELPPPPLYFPRMIRANAEELPPPPLYKMVREESVHWKDDDQYIAHTKVNPIGKDLAALLDVSKQAGHLAFAAMDSFYAEAAVTRLNDCKCCELHIIRRPKTYKSLSEEDKTWDEVVGACKCQCYKLSLEICRACVSV